MEYRRIDSQDGHAAGRALLGEIYRKKTGKDLPQILKGPRGKPYLEDGSCHFSISHTKRHVFCVLSDKPVGIDAEEKDRKIDLRLAEKILSPAEKLRYDRAENKEEALLKFWVLKEAAGKATGQGINGYPTHTEFALDDPRLQEVDGCFVAIIEEN